MDRLVGQMVNKLKSLKIFDLINIIITSDHGMTYAKPNCSINVFDYLDRGLIEPNKTIWGIISHVYPKPGNVCFAFSINIYVEIKQVVDVLGETSL